MVWVAPQRLLLTIRGLRTCDAELRGLMVGQTFNLVTLWVRMAAVLKRVKAVVGVGLAKLLVGMQMVRMDATELLPADATCLRRVLMLAFRAGRQLMVDGTWLSRVEILELVRTKWKTPLTNSKILPRLPLWKHLVTARLARLMCTWVLGGLPTRLQMRVAPLTMLDLPTLP